MSKLDKSLRVYRKGGVGGNNIGKVSSINFLNHFKYNSIKRHEKMVNNIGMIMDYRCGAITDEDDVCLGRLKNNHGTIRCIICGAKWIMRK